MDQHSLSYTWLMKQCVTSAGICFSKIVKLSTSTLLQFVPQLEKSTDLCRVASRAVYLPFSWRFTHFSSKMSPLSSSSLIWTWKIRAYLLRHSAAIRFLWCHGILSWVWPQPIIELGKITWWHMMEFSLTCTTTKVVLPSIFFKWRTLQISWTCRYLSLARGSVQDRTSHQLSLWTLLEIFKFSIRNKPKYQCQQCKTATT